MHTFIRKYRFAIALGFIGLLSTCQLTARQPEPPVDQPAVIREGLRVGVLLPRTGSYAVTGQPLIQVFPLLMHKVNACGGVNAAPVTFIVKDDRAEPAVASRWMAELAIVDDVQAVIGGITSSVTLSLIDGIERYRVPIVSPTSTSTEITQKVQELGFSAYWARTVPSDQEEAKALAKLAIAKNIKSVAIAAVDNDYGQSFAQDFATAFQAAGGTVTNKANWIQIDFRSPDVLESSLPEKLGDAQAILVIAYSDSGGRWIRTALDQEQLGDRQLLLTSSVYTPRFLEEIGVTAAEKSRLKGALGLAPGANGKAYVAFKSLWELQEEYAPPTFAAQTWDAGVLVILAAEAAGRNSGQGIKSQLQYVANPPGIEVSDVCRGLELVRQGEDINYEGASGTVDIDSSGNVSGQYEVWTVNDQGRFDVLYPINSLN